MPALNEVADVWNYASAVLLNPDLTKKDFVENKIKEDFQAISRQSRTQKAVSQLVIEE